MTITSTILSTVGRAGSRARLTKVRRGYATRRALLSALIALGAAIALGAGACASTYAAQQAPLVENGTMRVTLYPGVDGQSTAALISYTIPQTTQLPARVRIPLIEGASIGWVGEVTTEVSPDIEREYRVESENGQSFITLTLEEYHSGQVDFSGLPLKSSGAKREATLNWVQSTPAQSTSFEVRFPANVHGVSLTPSAQDAPQKNEEGETLYSLGSYTLAVGDSFEVRASYKEGEGAAGVSVTSVIVALLVIVVIVVIALVGFSLKRSTHQGSQSQSDESDFEVEDGFEAERDRMSHSAEE